MKQVDASFDESNYGFTQFKSFLERAQKDGIVDLEVMGKGGDYSVSLQEAEVEKEQGRFDEEYDYKPILYFKQLLWSAMRLHQLLSPNDEKPTMNIISSLVKELDQSFSITDYKYAKKAGFKTMLMDAKREGLLDIEYSKDKNEYYMIATEKFSALQFDQNLHQEFFPLYYQKLLQKYDLYYGLPKLELFLIQLHNFLKEKKDTTLKEVFQVFEDDKRFYEFSSATCKKFCYYLIKAKYMTLSAVLNELVDLPKQLLAESKIISIAPFDEIVKTYIAQAVEKLRSMTGKINYNALEILFLRQEASENLTNLVRNTISICQSNFQ
jgi:hypothetical protein